MYGGGKKPSKLKIQKQSEDKLTKNKINLFKNKEKEMKQWKTKQLEILRLYLWIRRRLLQTSKSR